MSDLREMKPQELPSFVRTFVRAGDRCFGVGERLGSPLLIRSSQKQTDDLLHARVRLVTRPKEGSGGSWFVRAHLNDGSALRSIVIEGEALVRYFYRCRPGRSETLYSTLGVNSGCSPSSLRFAWRMRTAETTAAEDESLRRGCERAFNILANHDLRVSYDSCDTGAGRLQGQEGVANVVRAFLYAGARSIVSTLWEVDDTFTAALMKRFYANLGAGRDVSESLRLAKLELRRRLGPNATPYFWGPFTVVGDGLTKIHFSAAR